MTKPAVERSRSGWPTSSPEAQGVDSSLLAQVVQTIVEDRLPAHSLLIVRNGYLVLDASFYPFAPGGLHDVASVTKSVTATLVGIALGQGRIGSLADPMLSYFPERTAAHLDAAKQAITVADLLTMRSGLHCVNRPVEVTLLEMMASPDWVQFMLDLPMDSAPGSEFVYNSGGVHLLSAILTQATGQSAFAFAQQHLFAPLGIAGASWSYDNQGVHNQGWGNLRLHPADMARIGALYLQGGAWQGRQILSSEWVAAATQKQVSFAGGGGYGYLWWVRDQPAALVEASGRGGQRIILWPAKNAVIVTTGAGFDAGLVAAPLLGAIASDHPLPENPAAAARLQEALQKAASGPTLSGPQPVSLPPLAQAVSGKRLVPQPNLLNVCELMLLFDGGPEAIVRIGITGRTGEAPFAEYRAGLDGVPRAFAGRHGIPGLAWGRWTAEDTFEATIDEVGNINQFHLRLVFTREKFSGLLEEATGLGQVPLEGKIQG